MMSFSPYRIRLSSKDNKEKIDQKGGLSLVNLSLYYRWISIQSNWFCLEECIRCDKANFQ